MKRAAKLVVSTLLVLSTRAAVAQVDPFFWTRIASPPTISAFDRTGNVVASYPVGFVSTAVIVKNTSGQTVVWDRFAGQLTAYDLASSVVTVGLPIDTTAIAFDSAMGLWTLGVATLGGSPSYRRYSAGGGPDFLVTGGVVFPVRLVGDPIGNMWSFGSPPFVEKIDVAGNVSPLVPITGTQPTLARAEVDAAGRAWVMYIHPTTTGPADLVRIESDAVTTTITSFTDVRDFDLDALGRPVVLTTGAAGSSLRYLDEAFAVRKVVPMPAGFLYTGFELDTSRHVWLRTQTDVVLADPDGALVLTLPIAFSSIGSGDPLGTHVVQVLDRDGDGDGDGVANRAELAVGTDPLDPNSTPPSPSLGGVAVPGSVFSIDLAIPSAAGRLFVTAAAGGLGAGFPVDDERRVPLASDGVFSFWFGAANPYALPIVGTLDATGAGATFVAFPATPLLTGVTLHFAALALDPMFGLPSSIITAPLSVTFP